MRIFLLQACFFLVSVPGLSAQHDSTFIEHFSNRARINTGFRWRERNVSIRTPMGEALELEKSDFAFRIGGRYGRASYTFSIPLLDLRSPIEGEESKNFSLGLTLYLRRQLLSGRFRHTQGFRVRQPEGNTIFRPDVDQFTINVFGYHVINHQRYSLRAGMRQRDRQLKSQGSFLVGGLADYQQLTSEDGLDVLLREDEPRSITRIEQQKYGVGGGYAYSLIMGKRFFLMPAVILGPEFRFVSFEVKDDARRQRERVHVSPRLRTYVGVGWNGDKTAVSITGIYQPVLDQTDNLETRFSNHSVELRITRRILFRD